MDRVYDAMIAHVDRFDGSVIDFAGDAMLCWFGGEERDDGVRPAALRAFAAGFAMQRSVAQFTRVRIGGVVEATLALKVAITAGPTRRFVVGDPSIQLLDVIAGPTLDRLGLVERQGRSGEVVVDTAVAELFGSALVLGEARQSGAVVVERLVDSPSVDQVDHGHIRDEVPDDVAAPWMLAAVRDRLAATRGEFMAELRPAVAVFLKFHGLEYLADPDAGGKLDTLIRWVQQRAAAYEGHLLQVTMGDKGSYLYLVFGAPTAHEDDVVRAVSAALELREGAATVSGLDAVQIGISRGRMRAGTYGGSTRRAYGVMGREVNVAARMMMQASAGEILASQQIADALRGEFEYREHPPLMLKGLSAPRRIFALERRLSTAERAMVTATTLIGRAEERRRLRERIDAALRGQGGSVLIEGEPGIGKSELVRHVKEEAASSGLMVLSGSGIAIERATLYNAWRPVFTRLLGLSTLTGSAEERSARVTDRLRDFPDGERLAPLMGAVLQVSIADTAATASLTGQVRAETTREWLASLLSEAAGEAALVVALEDVHWLDSASWALVLRLLAQTRVFLLMTARASTAEAGPEIDLLRGHPAIERMSLGALPADDVLLLVRQRLGVRELPRAVATLIRERAEGNPFFSEELAFALRDAGAIVVEHGECRLTGTLDLGDRAIPDSVEGVVTSRIDRLDPSQQVAIKVASVIGRTFGFRLLRDVHPVESQADRLPHDLRTLTRLDLTSLQSEQPELVYLFRHAITQAVAYNLMLFAQRRSLHRAVAEWHERTYEGELDPFLPLLAHHWTEVASDPDADTETIGTAVGRLRQAAEQATQAYANGESVGHLIRALGLLTRLPASRDRDERELQLQTTLGYCLSTLRGYGDPAVQAAYGRANELSEGAPPSLRLGFVLYGLFSFYASRGEYESAGRLAERLEALSTALDDAPLRAVADQSAGISHFLRGDLTAALARLESSRRQASGLAESAFFQYGGDFQVFTGAWIALAHATSGSNDAAWRCYEEVLDRSRDQPFARGFVLCFSPVPAVLGAIQETIGRADELISLAERYGFVLFGAVARVYRGWALARGENAVEGPTLIVEQLPLLRAIQLNSFLPLFLSLLADAWAAVGRQQEAAAALGEADSLVDAAGGSFYAAHLRTLRDTIESST